MNMVDHSSIKMGATNLQPLKAKIGAVLTGYAVTMVTYYDKETTITCSPMIKHLFDRAVFN